MLKARETGLAGPTLLRGPTGFGRSSFHGAEMLRLSEDLPIVIEMVDTEAKAERLIAVTEPMLGSSLVTTEKANVVRHGRDGGLAEG